MTFMVAVIDMNMKKSWYCLWLNNISLLSSTVYISTNGCLKVIQIVLVLNSNTSAMILDVPALSSYNPHCLRYSATFSIHSENIPIYADVHIIIPEINDAHIFSVSNKNCILKWHY